MFPLQAAGGAAEAFKNAKQTREAVGQTLRDINAMLANLSEFSCFLRFDVELERLFRLFEVGLSDLWSVCYLQ